MPPADDRTVTVCLCTFRRPHIVRTLESIAAQRLPHGFALEVVVADNDVEPSARQMVLEVAERRNLRLTYVHAPARNISVARNACLAATISRWLAFLDDDEVAELDWLARLLAARHGMAAVFGPTRALYRDDAPAWVRTGDFHSNAVVTRGGAIVTGYSCNVLLDAEFVHQHGLSFDERLGLVGGEDTIFMHAIHRGGGRLAYAPDALVSEEVPADRAGLGWLVRRRYRVGQIHGLMIARFAPRRAFSAAVLAVAKTGYCLLAALAFCWRPAAGARHLLRGMLHVGVVAQACGFGLYREYDR